MARTPRRRAPFLLAAAVLLGAAPLASGAYSSAQLCSESFLDHFQPPAWQAYQACLSSERRSAVGRLSDAGKLVSLELQCGCGAAPHALRHSGDLPDLKLRELVRDMLHGLSPTHEAQFRAREGMRELLETA